MGFLYREKETDRAYDRGYSAYYEGCSREECPYSDDDYVLSWKNGWRQAEWDDSRSDDDDCSDTSSFDIGV